MSDDSERFKAENQYFGSHFTGLLIFIKSWHILRNNNGQAKFGPEQWDLNEMLEFVRSPDGTYKIVSLINGQVLMVSGGHSTNGTMLFFYLDIDSDAQKWRLEWQNRLIDGVGPVLVLKPVCAPGLALDADSYPHIWDIHRGENQLFAFFQVTTAEHVRSQTNELARPGEYSSKRLDDGRAEPIWDAPEIHSIFPPEEAFRQITIDC